MIPRVQILLTATSYEIQRRLNTRTWLSRFESDEDLFLRTQQEFLRAKSYLIINTVDSTLKIVNTYTSGSTFITKAEYMTIKIVK